MSLTSPSRAACVPSSPTATSALGRLYRRAGNGEQALDYLTTAITMYREMDMRFYLTQAEAELTQMS